MMRRGIVVIILCILILSFVAGQSDPSAPTPIWKAQALSPAAQVDADPISAHFPRAADLVPVRYNADGELAPHIRLVAGDPSRRWRNPAKVVEATFPENFQEAVRVRSGSAHVSARPLDANSARAKTQPDGSLVYENAFDAADVHYRCSAYKTEEYIVVRDNGQSRRTFRWSLEMNSLQPRLTPAHTIEFCDSEGVPRLRINAPVAKDAEGKLLREGAEIRYELNGNELALHADLSACNFPVVIDPTWSSTGTMAVGRWRFGLTVLQNGKVLACGGQNANAQISEIFDPISETWSVTGSMSTVRGGIKPVLLNDGRVIAPGGFTNSGGTQHSSVEIYTPASGMWTAGTPLNNTRSFYKSMRLADNRVIVVAGRDSAGTYSIFDPVANTWSADAAIPNPSSFGHQLVQLLNGKLMMIGGANGNDSRECSLFDPTTGPLGSWTLAGSLNVQGRLAHAAIVTNDGKVIACGGMSSGSNAAATSEIYDPVTNVWTNLPNPNTPRENCGGVNLGGRIFAFGGITPVGLGFNQVIGTAEEYVPGTGWVASFPLNVPRQEFEMVRLDANRVMIAGGNDQAQIPQSSCEILVLNDLPQLSLNASPSVIEPGDRVSFALQASDPNGDALSFAWDFGDGMTSTEQSPTHAYVTAGTYLAKVTVTDALGLKSVAKATITVVKGRPAARFTTSDVVGFVGLPLTFDGAFSSDPENALASYAWDFGDGSPIGTGQVISRVYTAAGTYRVTLTVTDAVGLTSSTSRLIEVLPADQRGLFNGFVDAVVKFNRVKPGTDSLTIIASLNTGNAEVQAGSSVAIEIGGARYTGTLDTKFRDTSSPDQKWQVKANTRGQAFGSALLKFTLRKATIADGFEAVGVLPGENNGDPVTLNIPIRIEIAGRIFDVSLPGEFDFSRSGQRVVGTASSED